MAQERNLSADICWEPGNTWRASLSEHPPKGGRGVLVWERGGMRTEHNAVTAIEAAYQREQKHPCVLADPAEGRGHATGASRAN